MPETEDPIIAAVCADLKRRSELGIAKYGTTLARTDLGRQEWLQHAYEEALDLAAYLKRLMVEDQVVETIYTANDMPGGTWLPISSLPDGEHVLLYWPKGERGVGGIECATVYRYDDAWIRWTYWTHGGPNAGSDWDPKYNEEPTHWMPLPDPPDAAE